MKLKVSTLTLELLFHLYPKVLGPKHGPGSFLPAQCPLISRGGGGGGGGYKKGGGRHVKFYPYEKGWGRKRF